MQRPFEHGADVVVHSVTKYLAGHSDVVLGAALADDDDLHARLHAYRTLHGSIAGPFEVWLALRGLRTLALRVERAQTQRRRARPTARRAPRRRARSGTRACPRTRATSGPRGSWTASASIIGLRPHGGPDAADAVVAALRLWVPATSLGGVESSLERRRRFATESVTVPEDLLRMSVGIEDVEDLWRRPRAGRCERRV